MDSDKEKQNDESFIDESLVIDRVYYDKIKEEVTCLICYGLVSNPIMCDHCETHFCYICIENWKKKKGYCPKKCPAPFTLKKTVRSFKNIIGKVILLCKVCKEAISLLDYPDHYKQCVEKNSYIICPFCKDCKIRKNDINEGYRQSIEDKDMSNLLALISNKKADVDLELRDYKRMAEKRKTVLEEKLLKLDQEFVETRMSLTEQIRKLKIENEKYIKEAFEKNKENYNLMKEIEKLTKNERLRSKSTKDLKGVLREKPNFTEQNILKEFTNLSHCEVINTISSMPFNNETVIVSGGRDKLIKIWSMSNTDQPILVLKGHNGHITNLICFCFKSEWLIASASIDKTIKIWKINISENAIMTIKGHTEPINCLMTIYYKGELVLISSSQDCLIKVWRLPSVDVPLVVFKSHTASVNALESLQVDYKTYLVSGSKDHTIKLWGLNDTLVEGAAMSFEAHSDAVFALKIIKYNGNDVLASSSRDFTIKIWLVMSIGSSIQPLMILKGHFDFVRTLSTILYRGECFLVSGSWDKTIKIWNLNYPDSAIQTLKIHQDYIASLYGFSYKGETYLVSGSQDASLKIFKEASSF